MPSSQSGKIGGISDERLTTVIAPSLHGTAKVSISGDLVVPSPTFYSAIALISQSLVSRDWDSGTVSITLSMRDDVTRELYTWGMRLDMTAT
jgi:hypothetical protein